VQLTLHRLEVPHLADEDDVRILAKRGAQRARSSRSPPHLALADHALVVVARTDGVLDRDDVIVPVPVHEADHRGQRRGLSGAGDARDQDHPAALHRQALEDLGQTEILEVRRAFGDVAEHGAHIALTEERVDAKPTDPGNPIPDVDLAPLKQLIVALLAEQGHDRAADEFLVDRGQVV
jgi:hypothetical protein